ncbi:MAG TPA: nitrilase-related carbon-nitrogen hydrolase [Verrucomicrobiota bacterium]|jgi:apolipoprotein N-acyltransferase|nr:nitrilase-related carbon-nitrogen hydrolase [Verrucomicrobiota bacterium]HQL78739.1 nitrilase-related carbon-nitrogen hydrolase [Verrucomicrobiota bacterium]
MTTAARLLLWITVAAAAFHAAYAFVNASFLMVVYLFALLRLAQTDRWRMAFYAGLGVGLLIAAARLTFFWRIFSCGAIALWLVYAFWLGLFVALARLCLARLGPRWGWVMIPFVWTGLEYFRSELYYLRFSWLNVGYAFAGAPWQAALKVTGTYGAGFLLVSVASAAAWAASRQAEAPATTAVSARMQSAVLLILGAGGLCLGGVLADPGSAPPAGGVRVAGVQMEFPTETEVLLRLDELIGEHPETELVVLSEYTFGGLVPEAVRDWCRENRRYLIAGGKAPAPGRNFYNTAFVVGPDGDILFQQVKAVPIQFFKDGLPASTQELWDSPWGKIGICVCYDLSYTRVTDRLVRLRARAIIVPNMDVARWGEAQHHLHARVAPVRAAEYALPIFRVASSGISQWTDRTGRVLATAPFPGDGAILAGTLDLRGPGRLPPDRWLALVAVGVTALLMIVLPFRRRGSPPAATQMLSAP